MFNRLTRLLFVLSLTIVSRLPLIHANCGLQGCPSSIGRDPDNQARWIVEPGLRWVKFDLDGHSGHYTMFSAQAEYYGWRPWIFGGFASLVGLEEGGEDHTGLGNPVVFGEYRFYSRDRLSLSGGAQLEMPLGDDEHGIAADHTELVPYLTATKPGESCIWEAIVGYRTALGSEDHDEGHHELFVNPHEDKEFLYRLALAPKTKLAAVHPKIFIDGQHVLEGDNSGTGFLTAGASANIPISGRHGLEPYAEIPLTSPRRFEWKLGVNLMLRI